MVKNKIRKGIHAVMILNLLIFGLVTCRNKEPQNESGKEKQVRKNETHEEKAIPKLLVLEGKKRDLGKISEGIRTDVTFTLVNMGKADASNISVHDLSKGGCTAVSQVSNLAAGDTAKLRFIFETLGYGGQKETRQIKVRYDNPELSPLTLSVTAEVVQTEEYQVPIGELYYNFFVLVDVRNEQDFREGHIAGAINVQAGELLSWASQVPKDFMIYLYSDDGKKSDELAKSLKKQGFSEALSIIGGIEEWKRRYGERVIIEGSK